MSRNGPKIKTMMCINCNNETKHIRSFKGTFADVYTCLGLVIDMKTKRDKKCNGVSQENHYG